MRKATKTVATWFGIVAGIAGLEHGYFEILQGNARPEGLMIASMGPPCVAEEVWNACEPAMTILPNFLVTGILAVILSLIILIGLCAVALFVTGALMSANKPAYSMLLIIHKLSSFLALIVGVAAIYLLTGRTP